MSFPQHVYLLVGHFLTVFFFFVLASDLIFLASYLLFLTVLCSPSAKSMSICCCPVCYTVTLHCFLWFVECKLGFP